MKKRIQNPWLILVISLPIVAVIGCAISIVIAFSSHDQDVRTLQTPNSISALSQAKGKP